MKALFTALCLSFSLLLSAQLTFIVDAWSANTPAQATIYVAGDFQGWEAGAPAYQLTFDEQVQEYRLHLPELSGDIAFKFTRGSWPSVESDTQGNFVPNRTHAAQPGDSLRLQIAGWEDLSGGNSDQSTAADNVSIIATDFPMTALGRTRRVWLYLPPDYATSNRDYPVLYMHDGQNVFDQTTSFSGEWEVDETLNELFAQGDPGVIVVAVDNGGGLRLAEYTPWENPTYGGGEGNDYLDFLVNDLKPYIDANYRTRSEREWTGIMGSSLGGLISAYAALSHPDVFGKVGSLSPAYWINRQQLIDYVNSLEEPFDLRLHQIMGTPEGDQVVQDMYNFQNSLTQAGFTPNELRSLEHADGAHSEWYWAREFGEVYQWLFAESTNGTPPLDPATFKLVASPNPVRDNLRVTFELKEAAVVRMSLIDSLGRSYAYLQDGPMSAGSKILNFPRLEFGHPSGAYWLRVIVDQQVFKLPLILE